MWHSHGVMQLLHPWHGLFRCWIEAVDAACCTPGNWYMRKAALLGTCASLPRQCELPASLALELWRVCLFHCNYRDCAAYTFKPGGAPTNAKWTGPTLTLTQTTGSCVVTPAFSGAGNTRWTQLQTTLACEGPSTKWEWVSVWFASISFLMVASCCGVRCRMLVLCSCTSLGAELHHAHCTHCCKQILLTH